MQQAIEQIAATMLQTYVYLFGDPAAMRIGYIAERFSLLKRKES